MTAPRLLPAPHTIAGRILLVVVGGVLLPLLLVGAWLTRATERAGRALLRSQLESGMSQLLAGTAHRLDIRNGELRLLANNAAAVALLDAPSGERTAGDAETADYLSRLAAELAPAYQEIAYLDAQGHRRWPVVATEPPDTLATRAPLEPTLLRQQRIGLVGTPRGAVHARMRLTALVPLDSAREIAAGAVLVVRDTAGVLLWRSLLPQGVEPQPSPEWEGVTRTLPDLGIQLELLAPASAFVAPFEAAARTGLGVLGGVAILATVITLVLLTRVSRSLRELSAAASAVASGQLGRDVPVTGNDEIAQLGRSFNSMSTSLRETLQQLSRQRALAAVGEYAAGLSHEVRNALTAVRIDLQRANRHLAASHEATPLVGRALDSVRRLDGVVTSALRLARAGHVERQRVPVDAVVARACQLSQPQFDERGARLLVSVEGTPAVEGDGAALEQLLVNLLLNAAQALSAGGEAVLTAREARGRVILSLTDTGSGFDVQRLDLQGSVVTSSKRDGSGLGLPIARRIAEVHGGRLEISSRPGVGTTATLDLPAHPG